MQDILANIVTGVIQIIPLIAIPFVLKGVIDGVPVLGSALQKGFNKAYSAADKGQKAAGFGARRRAQVMNGERNMFGVKNRSGKRTAIENFGNRRRAIGEAVKSIEENRGERYRKDMAAAAAGETVPGRFAASNARIASAAHEQKEVAEAQGAVTTGKLDALQKAHVDNPNSTLGRLDLQRRGFGATAARSAASTDARWEEAQTAPDADSAGSVRTQQLNSSLAAAGLDRSALTQQAHETAAFNQSKSTATNRRTQDFSKILSDTVDGGGDQTLLNIAGGTVSADGQRRAQATAVEAGLKITQQNVSAARSLAQKRMTDQQLKLIQSTEKNDFGEALDANKQVITQPNKILEDMMKSNDVHEVLAARDEFMAQGQSGVMSALRTIDTLESQGDFASPDRQEILTQLKRTQLSEHGKQTKESASYAVRWAQGADTMRKAMQEQGRYTALTNDQLADQSTVSLLVGVANGAIDQHRAESILSDDKLRSKYDQEQTQILQMVKDHGADAVTATWNPDTGKLWKDEKDTSTSKAPTYEQWEARTEEAKKKPSTQSATTESGVDDDTATRSPDTGEVLPGYAKVPVAGSPTPVLKDYADKAGGPNRMSRETFNKFKESVKAAPDRNPDNQELEGLISRINADVNRRNEEAEKINKTAATNRAKGATKAPSGKAAAETYEPLNMPPMPAASEAPQPEQQQTPAQSQAQSQPERQQGSPRQGAPYSKIEDDQLRSEMAKASDEFGGTLESLGIDQSRPIADFSQEAKDRMFNTLRAYRQSLRNAGASPNSGNIQNDLREALKDAMEAAASDNNGDLY